MYGYKIQKPHTIPKIVWACKTSVTEYTWSNRNQPGMIEFSVSNAAKRTVLVMDRPPRTVEGKSFTCLVGDEKRSGYAEDGVNVEILSVAVFFEGLTCAQKELDEDDLSDSDALLLPHSEWECSEQSITHFENLLYRAIESYKEHDASAELMCTSVVFNLMVELDQMVRRSLQRKRDKYIHYYVDKCESILLKRYAERLTVKGIAEELEITPNYLSAIFKTAKGMDFTDRLLEVRMKKASELLREERISVSEIASMVGYEDVGHFRRRFKQYFGISLRDYRCINKELTLYHTKPQRHDE